MKFIKLSFIKTFIFNQIIGIFISIVFALLVKSFNHYFINLGISLVLSNSIGFSLLLFFYVYKKTIKQSVDSYTIDKILSFAIFMVSVYIGFQIFTLIANLIFPGMLFKFGVFQGILLLINAILIIGSILLYFFYYKLKKEITEKILENEKLKENTIKSELTALQSKINPHFLFNTLNSILDLAYTSPQKVEEVVINLSDIYRKILYSSDKKFHTLEEELDLIKKYLEIEKIRMGNRLQYEFIISSNIQNIYIPPLTIEPIVENAVIHGISKKKDGGKIILEVIKINNSITINVIDNGKGFEGEITGFGIKSVKERLNLIFKNKSSFKILSTSKGTTVKITFPVEV